MVSTEKTYSIEEKSKIYAKIVARVWTDPKFAESFAANPSEVISNQYGVVIPKGMRIVVLQNTAETFNLVMQAPPQGIEGPLSGAELAKAGCFGSVGSFGTAGTWCGTFGTAACLGTAGSYSL